MKHFEDLWNESEALTKDVLKNKTDIELVFDLINQSNDLANTLIKKVLEGDDNNFTLKQNEKIGKLLFIISALSNNLNIDVFAALKNTINEEKISLLELDED